VRPAGLRLGHFAAMRWSDADEARLPEVFVGGEGLVRDPVYLLGTLLHEAAHALAYMRGIKDPSRQGCWHNARFKALAEELDIELTRTTASAGPRPPPRPQPSTSTPPPSPSSAVARVCTGPQVFFPGGKAKKPRSAAFRLRVRSPYPRRTGCARGWPGHVRSLRNRLRHGRELKMTRRRARVTPRRLSTTVS
jgi:hypothetical protein